MLKDNRIRMSPKPIICFKEVYFILGALQRP